MFPLHVHTMASGAVGGDGYATPEELAARCIELGFSGCACTDHGTVSAYRDFTKAMGAKDLIPVYGIEGYQAARHRLDRPEKGQGRDGATGRNLLNDAPLPAKPAGDLRPGDRLRIETPGGGGWS